MQVARVQCGHGRVAHIEHGRNVCDAGRVPAQRLVKRRRSLPRVERGIYGAGRELRVGRGEQEFGRRKCKQEDGPTAAGPQWARDLRTQNMPYMVVTRDVSQLSGWLNADAYRNIWSMVVTPEVSQPETSALKFFKL